jgi:hypothetical protein
MPAWRQRISDVTGPRDALCKHKFSFIEVAWLGYGKRFGGSWESRSHRDCARVQTWF